MGYAAPATVRNLVRLGVDGLLEDRSPAGRVEALLQLGTDPATGTPAGARAVDEELETALGGLARTWQRARASAVDRPPLSGAARALAEEAALALGNPALAEIPPEPRPLAEAVVPPFVTDLPDTVTADYPLARPAPVPPSRAQVRDRLTAAAVDRYACTVDALAVRDHCDGLTFSLADLGDDVTASRVLWEALVVLAAHRAQLESGRVVDAPLPGCPETTAVSVSIMASRS